ncbi:polysaccharide deacetylase family protein [Streptosporangium carneum]|uniref:Glycosyl transferase n=1 Tax=Streptosporangium carneum TaxID=47481 RepID=A0A9W6I9N7_9ACTN|nr:polysaccharide deacetylase family protein [Streptosporangium carneum]GLK14362.1 glycosyl transferase [Streptosporangium carneum]
MPINICFHGVGEPPAVHDLEEGAEDYFVSVDLFRRVLDEVAQRDDVRLSFDDGFASDVSIALPELLSRGLTAEFFPIAGRLGTPVSVSADEVRALADAGMAVGSHGMHHRDWRERDPRERQGELVEARTIIAEAAGRPVSSAACPFGSYDKASLAALRAHGYTRVYTSDRRRAASGSWLQARYSVTRADTLDSVRREILADPSPPARLRAAVMARYKRWR